MDPVARPARGVRPDGRMNTGSPLCAGAPGHTPARATRGPRAATSTHTPADAPHARRAWLCALGAVGLAAAFGSRNAAAITLDELAALLGKRGSAKGRFYERQFLRLLDAPIDSTGELRFIAPGRLEKRTLTPRPELLLLDGDTLTVERQGMRRSMSLEQLPEVAAIVTSLRSTLAGDGKALARAFDTKVTGDARRWALALTPRDPRAQKAVRSIRIEGEGGEVVVVEVEQADGDRSVMRVVPTD